MRLVSIHFLIVFLTQCFYVLKAFILHGKSIVIAMQSHSFYKINSERLINKGIEIGTEMQKNRDRKGEGKERDKIKVSCLFMMKWARHSSL